MSDQQDARFTLRKRRIRPMEVALRGLIVAGFALSALTGCGFNAQGSSAREVGPNGEAILLDDIRTILSNTDLTTAQKRTELRGLGLTDEDLIDALLSSGN